MSKTRKQVSAGGVAYRKDEDGLKVAIVLMLPEMRWQLPKGHLDPGETAEQAALREVNEEAGVVCELVAPIDSIEYWFTTDRSGETVRIHKTVHFFLMKYISGDVADHDDEVAEARWATPDEALEMLAFQAERVVVRSGLEKISDTSDGR